MKADYDKVEDFFNHSSRFFERLAIIENQNASEGPLAKAIVRVFSAQLSICAIVEVMTKEKSARFSKIFVRFFATLRQTNLCNRAMAQRTMDHREPRSGCSIWSHAAIYR